MSNEMKLIKALCEALGFEVVETKDYRKGVMNDATFSHLSRNLFTSPYEHLRVNQGRHLAHARDDNGNRVTSLINPIVSYKLNPKDNKNG